MAAGGARKGGSGKLHRVSLLTLGFCGLWLFWVGVWRRRRLLAGPGEEGGGEGEGLGVGVEG